MVKIKMSEKIRDLEIELKEFKEKKNLEENVDDQVKFFLIVNNKKF